MATRAYVRGSGGKFAGAGTAGTKVTYGRAGGFANAAFRNRVIASRGNARPPTAKSSRNRKIAGAVALGAVGAGAVAASRTTAGRSGVTAALSAVKAVRTVGKATQSSASLYRGKGVGRMEDVGASVRGGSLRDAAFRSAYPTLHQNFGGKKSSRATKL